MLVVPVTKLIRVLLQKIVQYILYILTKMDHETKTRLLWL